MKRFVTKVGCFVAIQLAILTAVLVYGRMDAASNEYLYAMKDKYELLRETPSPRIIFVGGSNLAFGLDSKIVKSQLGLNPVNLGLHGSLGLYSILRMVKSELRPGDVVVLAPEITILFDSPACQEEIAILTCQLWPESAEFIQPDFDRPVDAMVKKPSTLKLLGGYVSRCRKRLKRESSDKPPATYRRNSFNEYGDHVAHHYAAPTFRKLGSFTEINRDSFNAAADAINRFKCFCDQQGVSTFFTHPPVSRDCLANKKDVARQMESMIESRIQMPIVTSFALLTFDAKYFYDSDTHLTKAGGQMRTRRVCRQIQRWQDRYANAGKTNLR